MKTTAPPVQNNEANDVIVKRTAWAALAFYLLIGFEFLYMASPFAAYFYSAYRPGLEFLGNHPGLAWLSQTFLPHIVIDTASPLVNAHNIVGAVLALGGFLTFCIGAGQVYYYKLTRKGAVTGGVYDIIRHPQYVSFSVCSFGLLLLWPRYIVLASFVTMLFAYYFLAKIEERECEEKFGQSYVDYKSKTNMFLPFRIPGIRLPGLPESGVTRYATIAAGYIFSMVLAISMATGINKLAADNLYAEYTDDAAYISVDQIDEDRLHQLVTIASSAPEIRAELDQLKDRKLLNYVLPSEWHVAEIPMNPVNGNTGHYFPDNYNHNRYRVVFTVADLSTDENIPGNEILLKTVARRPVAEVVVDLNTQQVVEIKEPDITTYDNIPVPVY